MASGVIALYSRLRKGNSSLCSSDNILKNAYHPSGTSWGNRHSWHAAEFVRRQIETLAAEPSEEAGEALIALASNKKLLSYRDHLRHAIANHAKIRRQHQYIQPDWDKTVETLRGGQTCQYRRSICPRERSSKNTLQ